MTGRRLTVRRGYGARRADAPVGQRAGQFRRLWTATAVSALGDGVRLTALPLLALSLTTDPLLLALVMVANWVPLLLSPLAGVLADVFNRRTLLVVVDVGRAVVVLGLALTVLTRSDSLAILYVASALLGLGETVYAVAAQSFLPLVVPPPRLAAANGRLYAAQLVFRDSIGQPLGGLVFVALAALPFLIDGASFIFGVVLLPVVATAPRADGPRVGWGAMIAEGGRHLRADRLLVTLAIMVGALNFFMAGIGALEVLYVVHWLGLPKGAFGLFLTAGALGGIAGGVLSARLARRLGPVAAALTALAPVGASSLLLGLTRGPVLAFIAFGAMSAGGTVYQTLMVSFRQATTPPQILGRVNGLYRLIGTCTAPVGAVAAGVLARSADVNVPFVVTGICVALLVAVTARPVLRMAAGRTDQTRPMTRDRRFQ